MDAALLGLMTVVIGVGGCLAYFYFSNLFLDKVLFPATQVRMQVRNINRANQIPALALSRSPAMFALASLSRLPGVRDACASL